jgi:hypothetical protein
LPSARSFTGMTIDRTARANRARGIVILRYFVLARS